MVQELIAPLLQEQRKLCFSHGGLLFNAPSPFLSSASTTAAAALPSTTLAPSMPEPPLRCPRCDSPNTKFCYYNNYNLTQPRHFCKTCRRYWTKGGALRNIPIGGGCRKTRVGSTVTVSCEVGKPVGGGSKSNKFIPSLDNYLFTGLGFEPGAEPKLEYMPQSIVWAPSPPSHPSHLLTLLSAARGDGFQNSVSIKEEAISSGPGMGLDPLGQLVGSQCRNEGQIQYLQQRNEVPHELYQKLPSTAAEGAYCSDHWITSNGWPEPDCAPVAISSAKAGVNGVGGGGGCAGYSAAAAAAFEPETGAEFGCWNPMLSWPDRPTTN